MAIPADVRTFLAAGELAKPSARDTTVRTAALVGSYAALLAVAFSTHNVVAWVAAWVWGGFVFSSAFAAMHEALHGSLYRAGWVNDLAGILWGLPILNPYAAYRASHLQHHAATHSETDSEPMVIIKGVGGYVATFPLVVLGFNALLMASLVGMISGHPPSYAKRARRRHLELANAAAFVAFFALVVVAWRWNWHVVAEVWLIPLAISYFAASAFATPEHYGCHYAPAPVFQTTRTTTSNAVVRFLLWNANYHTAHHLAPSVTGRNLPKLDQQIAERCEFRERSYSGYHRKLIGELLRGEIAESPPWADPPRVSGDRARTTR